MTETSLLHAPRPLAAAPLGPREYDVRPQRILWASELVADAGTLLSTRAFQPLRPDPLPPCIVPPGESLLIDFGCELGGSLELAVGAPVASDIAELPRVRIRFGESASEAMAELGDRNAGNDYALRDFAVELPWIGTRIVGPSGFRFVRIDAIGPSPVPLTHVRARLLLDAGEPAGSFSSSDAMLDTIWRTGAWTVRLNMHDHLWDGVKRDRLAWIGDLHPMVTVVQALYGAHPSVAASLDLIRDTTPLPGWMHGISSYSLWWILVHERHFLYSGNRTYLAEQGPYLEALVALLADAIDDGGLERLGGMRFLDWPSYDNPAAVEAGLQSLLVLALAAAERLAETIGDARTAALARVTADRARPVAGNAAGVKAALAFQLLAGQVAPETAVPWLCEQECAGLTGFLGIYVIEALARAGEGARALSMLRRFWGAMIERGATSFWEEFDIRWLEGSGRIDELTPPDLKDLHGDFGRFGHSGFRKSLCHGWSAGPTAFLGTHILGIRPLSPGFETVAVEPVLGHLDHVEGTHPTPHGPIQVRHERRADGGIASEIDLPSGVRLIEDAARHPAL